MVYQIDGPRYINPQKPPERWSQLPSSGGEHVGRHA